MLTILIFYEYFRLMGVKFYIEGGDMTFFTIGGKLPRKIALNKNKRPLYLRGTLQRIVWKFVLYLMILN